MSLSRLQPGDVIDGKYEVERILGAGGMGVVVAARHLDLGQRVAIKFMLREALAEPGHAERFLREAQTAVQLKSVHTARVLDVSRLSDGEPFMIMEYLEGRDLDAELSARGPLPPRMAVDWILQASEALAEAHGLGMIHRDVKLKNLFLTHTVDGEPLVKVLDFGLAKLVGAKEDVSLTNANAIFGSPQYMSPEQMRSAKKADFRSDVWSIGICLYELLTGRVPFEAETIADTCAMVLKDAVPLPSTLQPDIPPHLEGVVMRCLERDPARRWQSIAELACALQSYAEDPTSVRRIIRVQRARAGNAAVTVQDLPPAEASRRTLSAWDSGTPAATPMPGRTFAGQAQRVAGGIGAGVLLAAAIGAIAVFVHGYRPHVETASAVAPVTTFVPMDAPPAEVPPAPVVPAASDALPAPGPSAEPEPTTVAQTHPVVKRKARGGTRPLPNPYTSSTSTTRTMPRKNAPPGTGADYM